MHKAIELIIQTSREKRFIIGDDNRQIVCANCDDSRLLCSLLFIFMADRTKLQQGVRSV